MENKYLMELGSLGFAGFYSYQEARKAGFNRLRNVLFRKKTGLDLREVQAKKKKSEEEKSYLKDFEDDNLKKILNDLFAEGKISELEKDYLKQVHTLTQEALSKEKQFFKYIKSVVEQEKVWNEYLKYIKGVGPLMTTALLYYFGYCEKAKHVSNCWSYAGITPQSKYVKGESCKFNKNCRMFMLGRLADCLIKVKSDRYKPVYNAEKEKQLKLMEGKKEGGPVSRMHCDRRARRKMIKMFILDYWRMTTFLRTGKVPEENAYVIDILGHSPDHGLEIEKYLELRKKEARNVLA